MFFSQDTDAKLLIETSLMARVNAVRPRVLPRLVWCPALAHALEEESMSQGNLCPERPQMLEHLST